RPRDRRRYGSAVEPGIARRADRRASSTGTLRPGRLPRLEQSRMRPIEFPGRCDGAVSLDLSRRCGGHRRRLPDIGLAAARGGARLPLGYSGRQRDRLFPARADHAGRPRHGPAGAHPAADAHHGRDGRLYDVLDLQLRDPSIPAAERLADGLAEPGGHRRRLSGRGEPGPPGRPGDGGGLSWGILFPSSYVIRGCHPGRTEWDATTSWWTTSAGPCWRARV